MGAALGATRNVQIADCGQGGRQLLGDFAGRNMA